MKRPDIDKQAGKLPIKARSSIADCKIFQN